LSPEPPASHNDGFDEYVARQKRDPWRRRAHQQDREKERAQANKEMSYARPVVRWDGDKGIVLPGADEDVSHGENVAASHSDDETEIDNHALAAPFNDDPTPELTALVNSLLSKEKQGASSSEDDDNRSNYSAEETERHQKKDKRCSRGKSVSDTDEDDMNAEEAMLKDVVAEVESPNRQRPSRLSRHKRFTAKEKGKGREVVSQGDPSSEEGGEGEGGSVRRVVVSLMVVRGLVAVRRAVAASLPRSILLPALYRQMPGRKLRSWANRHGQPECCLLRNTTSRMRVLWLRRVWASKMPVKARTSRTNTRSGTR